MVSNAWEQLNDNFNQCLWHSLQETHENDTGLVPQWENNGPFLQQCFTPEHMWEQAR